MERVVHELMQVWTTIFSCLLKGRVATPQRPSSRVHQLRAKKLKRLADMLNDGTIPAERPSLMEMKLNNGPSKRLNATDRAVTCIHHGGGG